MGRKTTKTQGPAREPTVRQYHVLSELAKCPSGVERVNLHGGSRLIAGQMVRHGWVEIIEGGGLKVYIITDEGRKVI